MIRLDEIKARADAATEGPWCIGELDCEPYGEEWQVYHKDESSSVKGERITTIFACDSNDAAEMGGTPPCHNDAEFIAHARADVPWLLEQLDKYVLVLGPWFLDDDKEAEDAPRST